MSLASFKSLIDENSDDIAQFVGYVAVSGAALCVDFTIYWGLLSVAHYAFMAAVGGYICGVLSHYFMSSRVVFRSRFQKRGVVEEAPTVVKFFAAGASGLLVTALVVGVLADVLGFHPLAAKLAASACSFVVVFLSLRLFVFNDPARGALPVT